MKWGRGALALIIIHLPVEPAAVIAQSSRSAPVCMAKIARDRVGSRFTIIVPPESKAGMAARGFVEEPCQGKEYDLSEYRQRICALARRTEPGLKDAITRIAGASPDELCAMAGKVPGW